MAEEGLCNYVAFHLIFSPRAIFSRAPQSEALGTARVLFFASGVCPFRARDSYNTLLVHNLDGLHCHLHCCVTGKLASSARPQAYDAARLDGLAALVGLLSRTRSRLCFS